MDHEQLRITTDLLTVMRAGVTNAIEHGAEFVAPPHLMLALLADPKVGPALVELVPEERVRKILEATKSKLPEVAEVPEGPLPEGEKTPFQRYDTFAFRSADHVRTMYLDRDSYKLFIEGARRAGDAYFPKHLAMGFVAVSVKDGEIGKLLGAEPQQITNAVYEL